MQRASTRRWRWILSAAAVAGISRISCRDWQHVDAFVSGLRCGMSIEDVRGRARSLGASEFIVDERVPILYGTHVAAEGSSRVYLGFASGRLQWVRSGAQAGLWTGMRMGLKRDLCSATGLVSLVVHGSPRWGRPNAANNGALPVRVAPRPTTQLGMDATV